MPNNKKNGAGKIILASLAGGFGSMYVWNNFHVPNDFKTIATAILTSGVISIFWFIVRKYQHHVLNIPALIGAAAVMAILAPPFIGWVTNFIAGNIDFGVDVGAIVKKYWFVLVIIAVCKGVFSMRTLKVINEFFSFSDDEEDEES